MHDEAIVVLGRGDRAVGLGRRVFDGGHLVALVQHDVGLAEGALGVAETGFLMIVSLVILEIVVGVSLVDHGRAGLQRVLDVEDGRERIVIDADELFGR